VQASIGEATSPSDFDEFPFHAIGFNFHAPHRPLPLRCYLPHNEIYFHLYRDRSSIIFVSIWLNVIPVHSIVLALSSPSGLSSTGIRPTAHNTPRNYLSPDGPRGHASHRTNARKRKRRIVMAALLCVMPADAFVFTLRSPFNVRQSADLVMTHCLPCTAV